MTAHCLPGPDQLAALGAVLCLYRGPAGSELTGWSQARAVRCESRLDSDGLCEALCFIDQEGRPCWKLYLLPDTDFLAWDWLGVGMSAECCEEAGIAERLWRRLSRHLLGPQWRANVLRFHVMHEVRGDAVVSRLLASQPPLSACGEDSARRIVRSEGLECEALFDACRCRDGADGRQDVGERAWQSSRGRMGPSRGEVLYSVQT